MMKKDYFRKTLVAVFLLITAFHLSVSAQEKKTDETLNRANFAGTWIYDAKKSNLGNGLDALYTDQSLVISYVEPEFKIVKTQIKLGETRSTDLIYYTDKRGERNKPYPFNQLIETESQTFWKKDVLMSGYKIKVYLGDREIGYSETVEKYKLSKDGKTLTIISELRFPSIPSMSGFGNLSFMGGTAKKIYRKKE
jgi:hypothetical protein